MSYDVRLGEQKFDRNYLCQFYTTFYAKAN